jgi:ribonuclease P protein component
MRRNQRLQRPEQFQRVRREGKSWAHPFFVLNAARNRAGRTRCGFVTGKQLGKAHDRNRAKRRVREAVRLVYDQIAPGFDLVFVLRTGVLDAPFAELQDAVVATLQRAKLWRPPAAPTTPKGASDAPDRTAADPGLSTLHLATDAT